MLEVTMAILGTTLVLGGTLFFLVECAAVSGRMKRWSALIRPGLIALTGAVLVVMAFLS